MASVEFIRIDPNELTTPHLHFLEAGAYDFGGMTSVAHVLRHYDAKRDILIEIRRLNDLTGCIYLTVTDQDIGRVLTSILLGAFGFSEWAEDLKKFYYQLAHDNGCDQFVFMGRRGFKKYFNELTEVATVFRVDLK